MSYCTAIFKFLWHFIYFIKYHIFQKSTTLWNNTCISENCRWGYGGGSRIITKTAIRGKCSTKKRSSQNLTPSCGQKWFSWVSLIPFIKRYFIKKKSNFETLRQHNCRELVEQCPFFSDADSDFIDQEIVLKFWYN